MGLHKVLAFIQVELIDALPGVKEGKAEEVVHGLDRGGIVLLAEVLMEAVPGFSHGLEVRYICHGIICEACHRGDVVKVQSVRRVLLMFGFTRCLSPLRCVVAVVSVVTLLTWNTSAPQVVLVVLIQVRLVPLCLSRSV